MKVLKKITLTCEVEKGSSLDCCRVEAILLAIELTVNVEFQHNQEKYVVLFHDVLGCCQKVYET